LTQDRRNGHPDQHLDDRRGSDADDLARHEMRCADRTHQHFRDPVGLLFQHASHHGHAVERRHDVDEEGDDVGGQEGGERPALLLTRFGEPGFVDPNRCDQRGDIRGVDAGRLQPLPLDRPCAGRPEVADHVETPALLPAEEDRARLQQVCRQCDVPVEFLGAEAIGQPLANGVDRPLDADEAIAIRIAIVVGRRGRQQLFERVGHTGWRLADEGQVPGCGPPAHEPRQQDQADQQHGEQQRADEKGLRRDPLAKLAFDDQQRLTHVSPPAADPRFRHGRLGRRRSREATA
jgi:hypothetical protein